MNVHLQSQYLQLLAAWGDGPSDEEAVRKILRSSYSNAFSEGVEEVKKALFEAPMGTYDSWKNMEKFINDNF